MYSPYTDEVRHTRGQSAHTNLAALYAAIAARNRRPHALSGSLVAKSLLHKFVEQGSATLLTRLARNSVKALLDKVRTATKATRLVKAGAHFFSTKPTHAHRRVRRYDRALNCPGSAPDLAYRRVVLLESTQTWRNV